MNESQLVLDRRPAQTIDFLAAVFGDFVDVGSPPQQGEFIKQADTRNITEM